MSFSELRLTLNLLKQPLPQLDLKEIQGTRYKEEIFFDEGWQNPRTGYPQRWWLSLATFKVRLDEVLSNLIELKLSLLTAEVWIRWPLKVPANPNHFMFYGVMTCVECLHLTSQYCRETLGVLVRFFFFVCCMCASCTAPLDHLVPSYCFFCGSLSPA